MKIFRETADNLGMVRQHRAHQSIPSMNREMRSASCRMRLADERAAVEQSSFLVNRIRICDLLNSCKKSLAGTHESWIPAFSMTAGCGILSFLVG